MKIVLWGTYDIGKPRIRILKEGLRRNGFELIECHTDVWGKIADKSQVKGRTKKLKLLLQWCAAYPGLLWRYLWLPEHDLVLVSYPGMIDVLLIRGLAWLRRTPVVWDVFMSVHDTLVRDRHMLEEKHPLAHLLWACEWLALRVADGIFMDTRTHARRLETLYSLPVGICGAVWVGVEEQSFPRVSSTWRGRARQIPPKPLRILFYGQFIPLHGIEVIIEAARQLRQTPIEWQLIGKGQEADRIREMLREDPLPSLHWIEWVDYPELIESIKKADICLGIFGTSAKAASVIPNKVFQILSAGKPLITRDSPAIRELLRDSPPCVYLILPGRSDALADAINRHIALLQKKPDLECSHDMVDSINAQAIGLQFQEFIQAGTLVNHEQ